MNPLQQATQLAALLQAIGGVPQKTISKPSAPASLDQQIRRNWKGNWDEAGQDRAKELATLFKRAGVTSADLAKGLKTEDVYGWRDIVGSEMVNRGTGSNDQWEESPVYGDWKYAYGAEAQKRIAELQNKVPAEVAAKDEWKARMAQEAVRHGKQLVIGDKRVGFLGDVNNDGSLSNQEAFLKNGTLAGWSATGHGNVGFNLATDPRTGRTYITPSWSSSSDAGKAQDIAKITGTVAAVAAGVPALSELGAAGAAGAGAGQAVNWSALGSTALKGAGTNALLAAIGGARGNDLLKSALLGGVSGGLGSGFSQLGTAAGLPSWAVNVLSPALANAGSAAMSGARGSGILRSAISGGIGGTVNTLGSNFGWSPLLTQAAGGLAKSAVTGADPRQTLLSVLLGRNGLTGSDFVGNSLLRAIAGNKSAPRPATRKG